MIMTLKQGNWTLRSAPLLALLLVAAAPLSPAARHLSRVHTGILHLLASARGRSILRASSSPVAKALLARVGENVTPAVAPETSQPLESTVSPDASNNGCGTIYGTRFNLEPRPKALSQNNTSVDFLPTAGLQGADLVVGGADDYRSFYGGLGGSTSGYYVHRNGAEPNPCVPDFEGGLPFIVSSLTGEKLLGGGVAGVAADPARGAVFIADLRIGLSASAVGLFRSTAAILDDPTACPNGTHNLAAAQTCWPVHAEVNPIGGSDIAEGLAVDPRPLGSATGAGDVYVVLDIDTGTSVVEGLAVCTNSLSACSPAVVISGSDTAPASVQGGIRPDIAEHPAGGVTLTYENVNTGGPPGFLETFDLKYVTCTPAGAPTPPVCSAPTLIATEQQPIPDKGTGLGGLDNGALAASQFFIETMVRHAHRVDANGVETYVVWDRCHVPPFNHGMICPDADISLAASNNNGATWQFGTVDNGSGDQYFPAIVTDPATNIVNIAYYSTTGDVLNHRAKVVLRQIPPGPQTPDPVGIAQILTSVPMEPAADFFLDDSFIGNFIGVAARTITTAGGRAYVHYMHNIVNGIYNGAAAPEQNNHLSRFDY